MADLLASSDEEEGKRGRSRKGKAPNLEGGHEASSQQLLRDYFADACTYLPHFFDRRFPVTRAIFLRITERLYAFDTYS